VTEVDEVHAARDAVYRGLAGLVIDTDEMTPAEAAEAIRQA
jgi:hypothetical protein